MSPQAHKYYEMVFLPRLRAIEREIASTPLMVLVWGPGKGGGDLYDKRLEIRNQLLDDGYAAAFSEEIGQQDTNVLPSVRARELIQALVADFIVVIEGSPGSIAEVHDFIRNKDISSKMLVFIDRRARRGYSYSGALREMNSLYGNVEVYKYPGDVQQCHLKGTVLKKLRILRIAKWCENRKIFT